MFFAVVALLVPQYVLNPRPGRKGGCGTLQQCKYSINIASITRPFQLAQQSLQLIHRHAALFFPHDARMFRRDGLAFDKQLFKQLFSRAQAD